MFKIMSKKSFENMERKRVKDEERIAELEKELARVRGLYDGLSFGVGTLSDLGYIEYSTNVAIYRLRDKFIDEDKHSWKIEEIVAVVKESKEFAKRFNRN